jgi:hypothetical protein
MALSVLFEEKSTKVVDEMKDHPFLCNYFEKQMKPRSRLKLQNERVSVYRWLPVYRSSKDVIHTLGVVVGP